MPFGPYDLHGEVYDRFYEEQIAVIVLLASDEECLHKTGCNLRALYLKAGFQVLYLPITADEDYQNEMLVYDGTHRAGTLPPQ